MAWEKSSFYSNSTNNLGSYFVSVVDFEKIILLPLVTDLARYSRKVILLDSVTDLVRYFRKVILLDSVNDL